MICGGTRACGAATMAIDSRAPVGTTTPGGGAASSRTAASPTATTSGASRLATSRSEFFGGGLCCGSFLIFFARNRAPLDGETWQRVMRARGTLERKG